MTTEQKIWSSILEMEFVSITRLMLEVNRDERFVASIYFFGSGLGAAFNLKFYPGDFSSRELMKMNIETSARDFLNEEAFINAKLNIEAVKRKMLECIHGAIDLEMVEQKENVEAVM